MKNLHVPVLLQPSIEALAIKPRVTYIDLTLGGAGHFELALKEANYQGTFVGFDADQMAISSAQASFREQGFEQVSENSEIIELSKDDCRLILVHRNFAELGQTLAELNLERIDAIFADLGTSTNQLTEGERGFSFQGNEPLDMRMNQGLQIKASDLVNGLFTGELEKLFSNLADVGFARQLAKQIIIARKSKPIKTTADLRQIVQHIVPFSKRHGGNKHPEAKVFQALRIAVNNELVNLRNMLPEAFSLLSKKGRLAVISFHSGEDRIVKTEFSDLVKSGKAEFAVKRVLPSETEISDNPASRSARLRCIEKL